MYDLIIIGAGISGLYIGNNIETQNFIILEQKKRVGGRIKTFKNDSFMYETGAYRFFNHHTKFISLLKKLKLEKHIKKMNSNKDFVLMNNQSKNIYNTDKVLDYDQIFYRLKSLTKKELSSNTIFALIEKYYDRETAIMVNDYNGYDDFIKASGVNIINDYKTHKSYFYNLDCGYSKIIDLLFENINQKVKIGETLLDIKKKKNFFLVTTNKTNYMTKKIIFTIPKENLSKIEFINSNVNYLNSVSSGDYIRVFAQYPKKNGKVWFHDINPTVTDGVIRKIIPENIETGLLQVCYNDHINAERVRNIILNGDLKTFIRNSLNKLFIHKNIPEPIFINCHYWKNANHYWLPFYDNEHISNYILNPIQNIYICGESYSNNQGWIEGALKTSDKVIKLLKKKSMTCKNKKERMISIEEVYKHNNKKSAWTVIDGYVYDITDFINQNKHPGGNIIETAMGKDITEIFKSIGHSNLSMDFLKQFYIGKLIKIE